MKSIKLLAPALAALLATGCVIVTDRDDWDDHDSDSSSWQEAQRRNADYIDGLRLGVSIEKVRGALGRADFSDAFRDDHGEVLVLRYRTHHRHSDGKTTRDETTPLVFVNGHLEGWGEDALRRYDLD